MYICLKYYITEVAYNILQIINWQHFKTLSTLICPFLEDISRFIFFFFFLRVVFLQISNTLTIWFAIEDSDRHWGRCCFNTASLQQELVVGWFWPAMVIMSFLACLNSPCVVSQFFPRVTGGQPCECPHRSSLTQSPTPRCVFNHQAVCRDQQTDNI